MLFLRENIIVDVIDKLFFTSEKQNQQFRFTLIYKMTSCDDMMKMKSMVKVMFLCHHFSNLFLFVSDCAENLSKRSQNARVVLRDIGNQLVNNDDFEASPIPIVKGQQTLPPCNSPMGGYRFSSTF